MKQPKPTCEERLKEARKLMCEVNWEEALQIWRLK